MYCFGSTIVVTDQHHLQKPVLHKAFAVVLPGFASESLYLEKSLKGPKLRLYYNTNFLFVKQKNICPISPPPFNLNGLSDIDRQHFPNQTPPYEKSSCVYNRNPGIKLRWYAFNLLSLERAFNGTRQFRLRYVVNSSWNASLKALQEVLSPFYTSYPLKWLYFATPKRIKGTLIMQQIIPAYSFRNCPYMTRKN